MNEEVKIRMQIQDRYRYFARQSPSLYYLT